MSVKMMYIPNGDTQNYPIYGLQKGVKTFGYLASIKIPKVVMPTNKKTLLYNFGD